MSKHFEASCESGVVTIDGFVVEATILSQGTASSTGLVFIDGGSLFYIASNALDIVSLIETMNDIITKVSTVLSGLDGGAPSPGTQASNISTLAAANAQLLATKDLLR